MKRTRPRVVVATSNAGKLREIRAILAALPIEWLGLAGLPPVRFPEEGLDYAANALAKARAVAGALSLPAVADDSGLEVDGLCGAPGPVSARFGGPDLDDAGRTAHLLSCMTGLEGAAREARFVCVAALVTPDGVEATARGECRGRIRTQASGRGGFGYDPVFEPAGRDVSLADLGAAEKNRISHRAVAFAALSGAIRAALCGA